MKYNSNGIKQWVKQYGLSKKDESMAIDLISKESIYVAGHSHGGLDGNTNLSKITISFNKIFTFSGDKLTQ